MKKRIGTAMVLAFYAAATLSACSRMQISDESKEAISEAENVLQDAVTTAMSGISDTADLFKSGQDNLNDILEKAQNSDIGKTGAASDNDESAQKAGILASTEDIELSDVDGAGKDYIFYYAGDAFEAHYTKDNWKVINSYRITNEQDITIICRALSDEHPIPGKDGESVRTAEDMAYEWVQHNLAYEMLPQDSAWKENARDVDINPRDQGKTFEEMYRDRTGRELTMDEIMNLLQSH